MAGFPGARPHVSVVIPAVNEATTIARAIEGVLADPIAGGIEVIVADGGSTDRTRDLVGEMSRRDPRVRLVENPAGVTPEGLNAAIRASRGNVIVRMDGHAEPDPGYLAACLYALSASGAWNVGGQMRKTGVTVAARAASAATTSPFGIGGGRRFHLLTEPTDVDSVWLGCWHRWVFERIGLFDPELVQDQDEELNQRILDAGGRIVFDPAIRATYLSRASWRGLLRQYYRYGRFKIRAIQKRPSLLRVRHLIPAGVIAVLAVCVALSPIQPWAGVVGVAGLGAWTLVAALFAARVAPEFGTSIPQVIAAYACIHAAYGVGTWAGLIRFGPRWFINREGSVPSLEPLDP